MVKLGWGFSGISFVLAITLAISGCVTSRLPVQECADPPGPMQISQDPPPTATAAPMIAPSDKPYPINLATALQLSDVRTLDVAIASQQVEVAAAQLRQSHALWLPTLYFGTDYFRHDGQIQDVQGHIVGTSKDSFMVGAGPSAVLTVSDAIFAPLAARRVLRAKESTLQAARNDSLLAVAEAYFNVQQARGELAGAEDVTRRADELVRKADDLFHKGEIIPELEVVRARTQAARSHQAVQQARERWRVASADLARTLSLDPTAVVEPLEPPHLRVTLIEPDRAVDELITIGLTNRPELAAQQALVQATLDRLRQEKLRPLIPSILVRGSSTPVTGTLSGGLFGGGLNDNMNNFGARFDCDIQVLWEIRNLGLGNCALIDRQRAERQLAILELFRTQDRVAAEVARAHAEAQSAAARLRDAEEELRNGVELAAKNMQGLGQTKAAGNVIILVVRPQEVVASIQALTQAYADYYSAVADYDRAQFRLYHALGHPAQGLTSQAAVE